MGCVQNVDEAISTFIETIFFYRPKMPQEDGDNSSGLVGVNDRLNVDISFVFLFA